MSCPEAGTTSSDTARRMKRIREKTAGRTWRRRRSVAPGRSIMRSQSARSSDDPDTRPAPASKRIAVISQAWHPAFSAHSLDPGAVVLTLEA